MPGWVRRTCGGSDPPGARKRGGFEPARESREGPPGVTSAPKAGAARARHVAWSGANWASFAYAPCGTRPLSATPSNQEVYMALAALGGHLRSNGPPGWIVLGRALDKLLVLEQGWLAGRRRSDR